MKFNREAAKNAKIFAAPNSEFSVPPLCSLCFCGESWLSVYLPQRHREHGGFTEENFGYRIAVFPSSYGSLHVLGVEFQFHLKHFRKTRGKPIFNLMHINFVAE